MDVEVGIYFTVNGPTLLKKGVGGERSSCPSTTATGAPLRRFIDQALDMGVKFYVCQPSLDLHGLTQDDLIDGVDDDRRGRVQRHGPRGRPGHLLLMGG